MTASERPLEGRTALVTGASRGIGAPTAILLAQAGARVAITARSEQELGRVAAACDEQGAAAVAITADLSDPAQVERLFREVDDRLGPLDAVVNNAALLAPGPLHELPREAWSAMLAVNLGAVIEVTQHALARMRPRGAGTIVNVASVAGIPEVEPLPGTVVYAATKAAVIRFSQALAAEQADTGIRVLSVSPGSTRTAMLAQVVSPEEHAEATPAVEVARRIVAAVAAPPEGEHHIVLASV